jgi:hypothetical protein
MAGEGQKLVRISAEMTTTRRNISRWRSSWHGEYAVYLFWVGGRLAEIRPSHEEMLGTGLLEQGYLTNLVVTSGDTSIANAVNA